MIYGTRICKDDKITGYLVFNTGKRVFLTEPERIEFDNKIKYYARLGIEKVLARQGEI